MLKNFVPQKFPNIRYHILISALIATKFTDCIFKKSEIKIGMIANSHC